jgi:hypothetical protein
MDSIFLFFAVLILRSLLGDPQTPYFRLRVLSNLPNVVSLFHLIGCVFDASLMPILCAGRPPSIQKIKSIIALRRSDRSWRDKWGVYVIVLEKPRCRPKLYVGSSVGDQGGLFGRMSQYLFVLFQAS